MGAAYTVDPDTLTSERIYEILFELDQTAPLQSFPVDEAGTPVTGIDGRLAGAPAPTFQAPPHGRHGAANPEESLDVSEML